MPDGMRRIRIAIAVALTAAVAMSAAAAGDDVVPKGLSRDQLFGTTLRAAKWDRTTIQVCWDNRGNVSVDHQNSRTIRGCRQLGSGLEGALHRLGRLPVTEFPRLAHRRGRLPTTH